MQWWKISLPGGGAEPVGGDEAGDDVEDDVGEDAPAADVKHRGARVPDIRREAKLSNEQN